MTPTALAEAAAAPHDQNSQILGWEPKVKFNNLVELMADADAKLLNDQLEGRIAYEPAHRE